MGPRAMGIGRARGALVFGQGDSAKGVITTVTVRIRRRKVRGRLALKGPVVFAAETLHHLRQVVVPVVDRLVTGLGLPATRRCFEVSVVNPAAASGLGRGVEVSGFSLDLPVFVALLSEVSGMLVPQDRVATGHIASLDGDIRPVQGIEAKVRAAVQDPTVEGLICPSLDSDASYGDLSPAERDRAQAAAALARQQLRLTEVAGIDELVRAIFPEETIALAALVKGFREVPISRSQDASPLKRAVAFLGADIEGRFWRVQEGHLLAGRAADARQLLQAYLRRQARGKQYDEGFGTKLLRLVQSVPRVTRRTEGLFPLAPLGQCLKVCRFASDGQWPDVLNLLDAAFGRIGRQPDEDGLEKKTPRGDNGAGTGAVEAVLGKISARALAREVGLPIDMARAAFTMPTVVVGSYDEFLDVVRSFYLTLLRHTASGIAPADDRQVEQDALDLLQRAFARKGGLKAACAEARDPVRGGMRFVLDVLIEQHKAERQAQHVQAVLKAAVDPLDFGEQVTFMEGLLRRIGPHLPPEARGHPASRYATHIEELCEAYVHSMDHIEERFRNL